MMQQKNFNTEGIIALFLVLSPYLYSALEANFFTILTRIILFPYLLLRLRTLIFDKTQYKRVLTLAIYFLALITLLAPLFVCTGGIYLFLIASGLGYISLGTLLLVERRLHLLMRAIGIIFLVLGSLSLYEVSYYPLQVNLLMETAKSMPVYKVMQWSMVLLLLLLACCFFSATKKQLDETTAE